jgi:hypothetical protein
MASATSMSVSKTSAPSWSTTPAKWMFTRSGPPFGMQGTTRLRARRVAAVPGIQRARHATRIPSALGSGRGGDLEEPSADRFAWPRSASRTRFSGGVSPKCLGDRSKTVGAVRFEVISRDQVRASGVPRRRRSSQFFAGDVQMRCVWWIQARPSIGGSTHAFPDAQTAQRKTLSTNPLANPFELYLALVA